VEDVILANGHNSCQIHPELNVSEDHLLFAIAQRNNLLMDMLANNAQQDLFKTQLTPSNVSDHNVPDNIKSNLVLLLLLVEDVKLANGQYSCQTLLELLVLEDH
jgi:hypothetical protein